MAPVRLTRRAGAILFLAAVVAAACERERDGEVADRTIELAHDTIHLDAGVVLHDVVVSRSAAGEFEPATIRASTGDVIRFTADDNGGHAILFDGGSLDGSAHDWLARTNQLRSPPLIAQGAAWIITLADAPAGEYAFRCATHNATGRIIVSSR